MCIGPIFPGVVSISARRCDGPSHTSTCHPNPVCGCLSPLAGSHQHPLRVQASSQSAVHPCVFQLLCLITISRLLHRRKGVVVIVLKCHSRRALWVDGTHISRNRNIIRSTGSSFNSSRIASWIRDAETSSCVVFVPAFRHP